MGELLVIGAGNQGFAVAGHLAISGHKVNMWNRSFDAFKELIKTHQIECTGAINGLGAINRISQNINDIMAQIIYISTPSVAHDYLAYILSDVVNCDSIIILSPGRTFGAICFEDSLKKYGCKSIPQILETQTIIHTCRKTSARSVQIYALKNNVKVSSIRKDETKRLVKELPLELRKYLSVADNVIETSMGNVGMILHCAPTLMNIGSIESDNISFKFYFDGISKSVADYIEEIDKERLLIANKLRVKLESTVDWINRTYNIYGRSIYESIRNNSAYSDIEAPNTIQHRYLEEDVPYGLVPLEYIAKDLSLKVPYIENTIDTANLIMKKDYRIIGRKIEVKKLMKLI